MIMLIRFQNEVYDLSLSAHRRSLHESIDSAFSDIYEPNEEDFSDLDHLHKLISNRSIQEILSGFWCNGELDFLQVEQTDLLADALIAAGYQLEQSNVSRSIYVINDNNEEVRISDHKRPAIVNNGVYIGDHEYENEIIVSDNIVYLKQLQINGFSKLNKDKYLLG